MAFRMGAAFLAPRSPLLRDVGRRRQSLQLQELLLLKKEYGMSLQALLYRLKELEVISEHQHRQWSIEINRAGWRTSEPDELPPEKPKWLQRSVYRAFSEGLISEDEAKRFIGEAPERGTPSTLRRRHSFMDLPVEERRQVLAKQAEDMQEHYRETRSDRIKIQGGSLHEYGGSDQEGSDQEEGDTE